MPLELGSHYMQARAASGVEANVGLAPITRRTNGGPHSAVGGRHQMDVDPSVCTIQLAELEQAHRVEIEDLRRQLEESATRHDKELAVLRTQIVEQKW